MKSLGLSPGKKKPKAYLGQMEKVEKMFSPRNNTTTKKVLQQPRQIVPTLVCRTDPLPVPP